MFTTDSTLTTPTQWGVPQKQAGGLHLIVLMVLTLDRWRILMETGAKTWT